MKNFLCFIIFWFLVGFLTGCRAKLDTSRQESRRHTDEIGVVLRRLDSLGSTIAERQHIKVEFYPLFEYGRPNPASETNEMDTTAVIGPSQWTAHCADGSGFGSVKSIEISTERTEGRSSITATDSVVDQKTIEAQSQNEDKSVGARQDNGTVIGLAIVAAVALLVYLLLKSALKP